jgi:hypothetical protein
MSLSTADMNEGTRFVDPRAGDPKENTHGQYVVKSRPERKGGLDGYWVATNLKSNTDANFYLGDLGRLQLVPSDPVCEFDLDPLVGTKVELETTFGGTLIHGTVTNVIKREILGIGVIPIALIVDHEEYALSDLARLTRVR